uniref:Uncharacterized protein n=1 Tax=Culex tarsalis TaxID=7177 RepID=A0A1Q3EW21_CULTA
MVTVIRNKLVSTGVNRGKSVCSSQTRPVITTPVSASIGRQTRPRSGEVVQPTHLPNPKMEENVISMFMDVKLDIRERKLEFSHLKSWTRYFVRVEAVKCFPCYMKISFFKSATEETTDLIVRINIPGLTVQMATSRTRAHSYGLFWKHNRKRCCAYFALASQLLCERHLRWMKKSIRNLELYRQEILQLRRASRTPAHEFRQEMHPGDDELGLYQNLDLTQDMAKEALHDILGPLPNVPTVEQQQQEASLRRISGVSGIYEEIFDPARASGAFGGPRASVVSGIYEEMKLADIREGLERSTDECVGDDEEDIAPPLPPRPRSHTNEFELQRSYTTPESDYLKKKKHWLLFESMFGRRRTNSGSSGAGAKTSKAVGNPEVRKQPTDQKVVYRDKVARLRFSENKRNSFSSPDLSALKVDEGGNVATSGDNLSDEGSCSSEFYVQREVDYIEEDCFLSSELLPGSRCPSIEESLANLLINGEDSRFGGSAMNVSEKVVPNLNDSCNSSTVNLVGFSCTMAPKEEPLEGYCEMGAPGTGFNRLKLQEVELRKPVDDVAGVVESIYMDMVGKPGASEEASRSSSTSSGVSSMYSNTSSVCSSGKQRNSIDDKIPSYYPNEDFRTPKKVESVAPRKSPKPKEVKRTASPRNSQRKHQVPPGISTMPRACKSAQKPTSSKTKLSIRSASSERCATTPLDDASPTKNIENSPPERLLLFQKYATIARSNSPTSGGKYAEKNSSSKKGGSAAGPEAATIIGSSRGRFGSLPRFAKFDLSPLRLKINSVLQRHNSENL